MSTNTVFKCIYSSFRAVGVLTFFALSVANHEAPDYKNIFKSHAEQNLNDDENSSVRLVLAKKSGGVEFESYTGEINLPSQK